jgi:metal-dependent amidase/aminoacylase/carboxypeptidase family protein
VASLVSETGEYSPIDPTLGAEDFAFIAKGVPSAFFFLGQGGKQDSTGDADDGDISGCGECGSNVGRCFNP